jgi:hypothetical protein
MKSLNEFGRSRQAESASEARTGALLLAAEELTLSCSPEGKATSTATVDGRQVTYFISSAKFRKHFQRRYFERFDLTLPKRDLDDIIELLIARAEHGKTAPAAHRIAYLADGTTLLDTGNESGEVVAIQKYAWKMEANPGVKFVSGEGYRPLVIPIRQDNVPERFQTFFNATEYQFLVIVAWLVMLLNSPGPCPILNITGEGCFALGKFLRNLLDPNGVLIRGVPKSERDLRVAIERSWIVVLQVTAIRGWLNDWLGHMLTGAGFVTRKNYFDDEAITFSGIHPVILVGSSDSPSGMPGEHSLTIALAQMEPSRRRPPSTVAAELADLERGFLAYVLEAAVNTRVCDDCTPKHLPQMAEFYTIGHRVECGLLWPDHTFAKAFAAARLADEPALVAILEFGLDRRHWTGTATSLWESITARLTEANRNHNWPADPVALGKLLHKKGARLGEFGVLVKFWRGAGKNRERFIVIEATETGDQE